MRKLINWINCRIGSHQVGIIKSGEKYSMVGCLRCGKVLNIVIKPDPEKIREYTRRRMDSERRVR